MNRTLTMVVHGEAGAGKSYLADTSPGPRLIIDAEGGVRFTPSRKVAWDPRNPIPELGPDDSAVVTATGLEPISRAMQWLATGQHPFKSVVIDSLTEAQRRTKAALNVQDQRGWGELLDKMDALVRSFRDLTMHEFHPLDVVVFICGSRERGLEHSVVRPMLQGQMAELLPYSVDVVAYMYATAAQDGSVSRTAQFVNVNNVAAKDRTGKLGVTLDGPSVPLLLNMIYGEEEK